MDHFCFLAVTTIATVCESFSSCAVLPEGWPGEGVRRLAFLWSVPSCPPGEADHLHSGGAFSMPGPAKSSRGCFRWRGPEVAIRSPSDPGPLPSSSSSRGPSQTAPDAHRDAHCPLNQHLARGYGPEVPRLAKRRPWPQLPALQSSRTNTHIRESWGLNEPVCVHILLASPHGK